MFIKRFEARVLAFGLLAAAWGCGDATLPAVSSADEALIYGADDRREVYQLTNAHQIALADSTVALMDASDVTSVAGGYSINTSLSYGSAYSLCTSEPFRTQPTTAYCTGFLVAPDLVATAGHCISNSSCAGTRFVFGFEMTSSSSVRSTVPTSDVYSCAQVVGRTQTTTNDFAVVRLDRAVSGHTPLAIRRSGTVALGTPLVVSGHPAGIPLKVAGGATVRGNSATNYFEANVDTYGGNSGSPIIDANTGVVEGILVRGNADFVQSGSCFVSNVCSDSGCPGWEDATRIVNITPYVPVDPECAVDADCGAGEICVGGVCQVEPVCAARNEACSVNSDCCSGRCRRNRGLCR